MFVRCFCRAPSSVQAVKGGCTATLRSDLHRIKRNIVGQLMAPMQCKFNCMVQSRIVLKIDVFIGTSKSAKGQEKKKTNTNHSASHILRALLSDISEKKRKKNSALLQVWKQFQGICRMIPVKKFLCNEHGLAQCIQATHKNHRCQEFASANLGMD